MKKSLVFSKTFFFWALFSPMAAMCQKQDTSFLQVIDTSNMLLKAKVQLIQFMNFIEEDSSICLFLSKPIDYKLLQSKGFAKHLAFFEIVLSWNEQTNFQFLYEDTVIFAYNNRSKKLYRLKGFKDNEFKLFFNDLKFSNIDFSVAGEDDLKSKKRFINTFNIDGLDLKCLFDSLKKHKNLLPCEQPIEPFIRR